MYCMYKLSIGDNLLFYFEIISNQQDLKLNRYSAQKYSG